MKIELKKCPFCGGEAEEVMFEDSASMRYYITCSLCCRAESEILYTLEEAVSDWNTRYTE